ncbi:phage repressor protein CI [Vibrio scophthalmi]|uniref:Uncharacterized protein n=1 Tax=Vibrio scophthalmi TaxID=45658 RepID=A0A1C7F952_9VIBR|nr:phage repressor protein CI [Vibrio scophthalmi]ANU36258.1 hypothetical protein VSVS05_01131 [Vibrio scophthalmi]
MKRDSIKPFNYLSGAEFTKKLKRLTGCEDFLELGQLLGIPKSTFSTWNSHERTSHELMVRLHLALGTPIEELALSDEERAKLSLLPKRAPMSSQAPVQSSSPQQQTVILKSYCLTNGQLLDTGEIPYGSRIFNSWNLDKENTIEIETNDGRFLVDQKQNDAVSGEYLIDMNGRLSINHIQRLPNKLAVVFGNSTVEVSEEDIRVIGRVAVSLNKQ